MTISEKQKKEFEAVARPVMKWMSDNCHPHTHAIIDYARAELSEGVFIFPTEDYVKD